MKLENLLRKHEKEIIIKHKYIYDIDIGIVSFLIPAELCKRKELQQFFGGNNHYIEINSTFLCELFEKNIKSLIGITFNQLEIESQMCKIIKKTGIHIKKFHVIELTYELEE